MLSEENKGDFIPIEILYRQSYAVVKMRQTLYNGNEILYPFFD